METKNSDKSIEDSNFKKVSQEPSCVGSLGVTPDGGGFTSCRGNKRVNFIDQEFGEEDKRLREMNKLKKQVNEPALESFGAGSKDPVGEDFVKDFIKSEIFGGKAELGYPFRDTERFLEKSPENSYLIARPVHDELLTPGCPQCFYKHIAAAKASALTLAPVYETPDKLSHSSSLYRASCRQYDLAFPAICKYDCVIGLNDRAPLYSVYLAQAFINLTEYLEGYKSHLEYAIGLLHLAEQEVSTSIIFEDPQTTTQVLHAIRNLRLDLHTAESSIDEKVESPARNAMCKTVYKVMVEGYSVLRHLGILFPGMPYIQAHFIEAMREAPSEIYIRFSKCRITKFLRGDGIFNYKTVEQLLGYDVTDSLDGAIEGISSRELIEFFDKLLKVVHDDYFSCTFPAHEDLDSHKPGCESTNETGKQQ